MYHNYYRNLGLRPTLCRKAKLVREYRLETAYMKPCGKKMLSRQIRSFNRRLIA